MTRNEILAAFLAFLVSLPLLRNAAAVSLPKRCAEVAVLVDETFSMKASEQSVLLEAAERIAQGLQDEDYYPFVCVFGFGTGDISKLLGCSLGFPGSIELEQTGSVEDGWEAIVSAVNFFGSATLEFGDISRVNSCINVPIQKAAILITDEDRDVEDSSLSFSEVLSTLVDNSWGLNAILQQNLFPFEAFGTSISLDGTSFDYFVRSSSDGTSFDTVATTGIVFDNASFGSTKGDYVELVKQSGGGAIMNISKLREDKSITSLMLYAFVDTILMNFQSSAEPIPLPEDSLSICSQALPVSVIDLDGTVFIDGVGGIGSLEVNPSGLVFCATSEVNGVLPTYSIDFPNPIEVTSDLALELSNFILSLIQEAIVESGSSSAPSGVDCDVPPFRSVPCDLGCSSVFEVCADKSCSALAAARALCEPFITEGLEVTIDVGSLGEIACTPSLLFVDGRCGRCNVVTTSCIANGCSGVEDIATAEICFDSKCNEFYECPGNCTAGVSDTDLLSDDTCCGCVVPGESCGSFSTCGNGFCDFSETLESCFVDCVSSNGCGLGELLCSDVCVDVNNDPLNCGSCGVQCVVGNLCVLGQCSVPAPLGISWETTVSGGGDWLISNGGQTIRFDIEDSLNCGGLNDFVQVSTANATISLSEPLELSLEIFGVAELENSGFENMAVFLDNQLVVSATSTNLLLGCQMGPAVFTIVVPPPYPLSVGTHSFYIDFTTGDTLFHVDAFYELNLVFLQPVP